MKRFIICCATFFLCQQAIAGDANRSDGNASIADRLKHSIELLDGYRGDGAMLEAARAELESVLRADPRNAPAHREMARYFIMRGHVSYQRFQPGALEAAESSLTKAIKINPKYAEAYVLRGHLYRLMGRSQDAVRALETAEKIGTSDPWLQNNWADLLSDAGRYEDAAKRYRKVLASKTKNKKAMTVAYEGLIRYHRSVGQWDMVDQIYRDRIAYEPDAAWGYGNYAEFLLCYRDDPENAILRARQALRIMDYGVGRYWLAAGLYRKWAQGVLNDKPADVQRDLVEARALVPDAAEIAANAANCPPLELISQALASGKHPEFSTPSAGRTNRRM